MPPDREFRRKGAKRCSALWEGRSRAMSKHVAPQRNLSSSERLRRLARAACSQKKKRAW